MFPYRNLTIVERAEQKEKFLASLLTIKQTAVVSFLNAHAITLATKRPDFYANLLAADFLLRDGVGAALFLRLMGRKSGLNMNGTDLTPEILRTFSGKKAALCGTGEPWISLAGERVKTWGVEVVLCMDGFQDTEAYVQALERERPDIVILGMGMPKQEAVAAVLAKTLAHPAVIVNGGAILDFVAGRFPRAPLLWRKLRLEWVYRLIHEPRRLARRYLIGGAEFLLIALKFAFAKNGTENAL